MGRASNGLAPPAMFLLILGVVATMASSPSDDEIRRATRDLLNDSSIQKKLPQSLDEQKAAKAREQMRRQGRRSARSRRTREGGFGGGTLGNAVLYTGMAVVIGLLLFWFARDMFGYQEDGAVGEEGETDDRDTRRVVDKPLEDAEALARRGEFADAVHTLLLRTLMELSQRRGRPLPSSFTSREILERVGLPDAARGALAEIVNVVELSHFGDLPIGADEWRRCLDSYGRFAAAYLHGREAAA